MATDHGTPVARRLFVLPAITGAGNDDPVTVTAPPGSPVAPVTGPATAPVTGGAPDAATGLLPVPMTVPERARLAVRSTAVVWKPYVSFTRMLLTATPKSMAGHREHIKSRTWVPAELTGKAAIIIAWAGIIHHLLINRPVKAAGLALAAAADKTLWLYGFTGVLAVLILLLSHYL